MGNGKARGWGGCFTMSKVLVNTKDLNRSEWLEQRQKGIGGSDIAGILGISPWSSPIKVYQDKIGELPPTEETEVMYWGNVLEDVVAKEFQKRTGLKVRRRNAILQREDYPYMLANVDRLIVGKREGLECKTTNEFMKNDWVEGELIPEQYYTQCQWYMAVTGYERWHIAVLIGGNKFHIDVVERDDELIDMMIKEAKNFWENHVIPKNPPEFDGSRASDELLKYLYPESNSEVSIQLGNSYADELETYDQLKENEKQIKRDIKDIENRIKSKMEEAEVAKAGERVITWKSYESNRFDTKRFKEEYPDLYREFVKTSVGRRFSVK